MLLNEENTPQDLSSEQVTSINNLYTDHVASLKQDWDGKANENAEKIISGAVTYASTKHNIDLPREQGEKLGDYLSRLSDKVFEEKTNSLNTLKDEYTKKIEGSKVDPLIKQEYEDLKNKYSEAQKIVAEYDEFKTGDYKSKYENLISENQKLVTNQAFSSIKKAKPDNVNEYEYNGRWSEFQNNVLKDYDIKLVDDKYVAVSKENVHLVKPLDELYNQNKELVSMYDAQAQKNGFTQKSANQSIDGVDFKINPEWSKVEINNAIREHLISKGMNVISDDYAKAFADTYNKIKGKTPIK